MDQAFWDRLVRQESGCWLWPGAHNIKGYGRLSRKAISPVPIQTHRYAWLLTFGDPGPAWILHRCDNPPCCNPAHLFLGDAIENVRDMWRKGRQSPPPHVPPDSCPKGHPYTPANRAPNGPGLYRCRTCKRERERIVNRPLKSAGRPRLLAVVQEHSAS